MYSARFRCLAQNCSSSLRLASCARMRDYAKDVRCVSRTSSSTFLPQSKRFRQSLCSRIQIATVFQSILLMRRRCMACVGRLASCIGLERVQRSYLLYCRQTLQVSASWLESLIESMQVSRYEQLDPLYCNCQSIVS